MSKPPLRFLSVDSSLMMFDCPAFVEHPTPRRAARALRPITVLISHNNNSLQNSAKKTTSIDKARDIISIFVMWREDSDNRMM